MSEEIVDLYDFLCVKTRNLSKTFKVSFISTFIWGMLAFMFCYTNPLFGHDNTAIYYKSVNIFQMAQGGRWFNAIIFNLLGNIEQPWLIGILSLAMYALSSWMVCEILGVHRNIPVIFICGIMTVNVTTICSNCYLAGLHTNAFSLMVATSSIFVLTKKVKYRWLLAFVFIYLSASTYSPYLDFAMGIFLLWKIGSIISGKERCFGKCFKEHVYMLAVFAMGLISSLGTDYLLLKYSGLQGQDRVISAINISETNPQGINYIKQIIVAYINCLVHFSPLKELSYFQNQKVYYAMFIITFICSMIILFLLCRTKKMGFFYGLIIIDILVFPIAINFNAIYQEYTHDLEHYAYIIPWIVCIYVYELYLFCSKKQSKRWREIYNILILAMCIITMIKNCILANSSYMKIYNNYQASLHLVNRIVDRIEVTEGYVPGVTPVIFIGNLRENYAPYQEEYMCLDDLTGVGSPYYDTAITYSLPLKLFITQQLKISMNIVDIRFDSQSECIEDRKAYISNMEEQYGVKLDYAELSSIMDGGEGFPDEECVRWCGDAIICIL